MKYHLTIDRDVDERGQGGVWDFTTEMLQEMESIAGWHLDGNLFDELQAHMYYKLKDQIEEEYDR